MDSVINFKKFNKNLKENYKIEYKEFLRFKKAIMREYKDDCNYRNISNIVDNEITTRCMNYLYDRKLSCFQYREILNNTITSGNNKNKFKKPEILLSSVTQNVTICEECTGCTFALLAKLSCKKTNI